jgi:hypothetical protein
LELTERVKEYTGYERQEIIGKNFLKTKLLTPKSKAINPIYSVVNTGSKVMSGNDIPIRAR